MSFDATNKGVVYANLGLNSVALGSTAYTSAVTAATADGLRAYSNALVSAEQAALTDSDFATAVMANLGMTAAVIGQPAYDALQPALAAYVNAVGVANRGVVVVQLADIVAGLTADATFGAAATNLNNAAATAYVYSTNAANTDAKTIDVPTATAPSSTFTLTTSATDNLVGTEFADVFNAVVSGLASETTLNATDKVDGLGGADVMNITLGADFNGLTVGTGSISNVETINLTNSGTVARAFSAKGITGAEAYNVSGLVNLSALDASVARVNLKSITTGAVTIAYNAEAVVGTADSKTIGLEGVTTTSTGAGITLAGVETVNLVATGTNSTKLTAADAKTVTISGAGALTLASVGGAAVTTIDGSAATGKLTLTLTDNTGLKTVKTGAADDTITFTPADDLAANAVIDAGAGANKIVLTGAAANVEYTMTGVQTIDLGARTNTILNFSGAKSTAVSTINVGGTTEGTSNFSGMGTGALTLNIDGSAAASNKTATISSDHAGAAQVNVKVTSAATAASPQASDDVVTLSKASSVVLDVAKFGEYTGTLTADKAASVTVNVHGLVDNTIAAAEAKSVVINQSNKDVTASEIALTAAKLETLDLTIAGGLTVAPTTPAELRNFKVATDVGFGTNAFNMTGINVVHISGAATTSATTLGALGNANQAYGINVTATGQKAGLTLAGGMTTAADQSVNVDITGTTGARKVAFDSSAATMQVGAGTTGSITVNAAGSGATGTALSIGNAAAKSITMNVSASTGNASIGTLTAAATAGSVTVNAAGLKGDLNLGAVGTGTSTGTTATINATGVVGAVTASTISAKTVSVDVNDVTKAVSLGALTGDSVTVKAANTAAGVTNNGATVKNSLVYEGSSVNNNSLAVTVGAASTAFTAKLDGGFLQDTHTITSTNATQTSITLTGNLGNFVSGAADTVTVKSTSSTVAAGQTIDLSGLTVATGAAVEIWGSYFVKNTIKGTAGNDVIHGGSKADVIWLGTGDDTVVLNNPTDTGSVDGTKVKVGQTIVAGGSVSTATLDVIYGFGKTDKLEVGVNVGAQALHDYSATLNASKALITGNYDSTAGTFTFAAAGKDAMFVYNGDNDNTTDLQAIVLVGYVEPATDNASTGITGGGA